MSDDLEADLDRLLAAETAVEAEINPQPAPHSGSSPPSSSSPSACASPSLSASLSASSSSSVAGLVASSSVASVVREQWADSSRSIRACQPPMSSTAIGPAIGQSSESRHRGENTTIKESIPSGAGAGAGAGAGVGAGVISDERARVALASLNRGLSERALELVVFFGPPCAVSFLLCMGG
jgi:hypothetical protein